MTLASGKKFRPRNLLVASLFLAVIQSALAQSLTREVNFNIAAQPLSSRSSSSRSNGCSGARFGEKS